MPGYVHPCIHSAAYTVQKPCAVPNRQSTSSVYMHVQIQSYVALLHIRILAYSHTETDRQADSQSDSQAGSQAARQPDSLTA